jgi:hypothetical protein
MHKSRVSAISIDVPGERREDAERFWSGALGRPIRRGEHHPEFSTLGVVNSHVVLIQALGDGEPRVHLDIHTDDTEAEVARLGALGAEEVARHSNWVIMRDPAGTVFCVVGVSSDDESLADAASWS